MLGIGPQKLKNFGLATDALPSGGNRAAPVIQCSTKVVRTKRGAVAKLDARLELRLDKRTFERLERRAAAGGLSVAQLVRHAIARELADDESSWREQVLERVEPRGAGA